MKNTKKIVIIVTLASLLVSVVATGVSITPSVASGNGSCTLSSRDGRTIVNFGSMIRSDMSSSDARSSEKNVSLDAGSYRVTLVSYDDHSGHGGQNQNDEAYYINFLNSNGNVIVKSADMRDLPGNIDTLTQVVNSSLRISDDVDAVVAVHSAYPSTGINSIYPVCVAFDRLGGDNNDEPEVRTNSASSIDDDSAVLNGEADPNNEDTDVWFEWGTASFNLNHTTNKEDIGDGTSFVDFDRRITGLDDDRTYYFRAVAENDEGIEKGSVKSFRTDDEDNNDGPEILNVDTIDIQDDSADLRCKVDPNGEDTDVWFEWDEDRDDLEDGDGRRTRVTEIDGDESSERVVVTIRNLDEDTRYYFRCFAENRDGDDESRTENFRTDDDNRRRNDDEPEVTTRSADDIDEDSAVLNGEVDPNGEDTDVWFEYGTSRGNLNRNTRSEDVGDGNRTKDFDRRISGLRDNTTYYFRAIAESREGDDEGSIKSFRTDGGTIIKPPIIITKIIEVIKFVEIEKKEKKREALIITLDSDKRDFNRSEEIEYTVSYDNETSETFTEAILIVEIPRELEFVDASPREDDEDGNEIIFEIGTIGPRDRDSFEILTELGRRVDSGDEIEFVASIEYLDRNKQRIVQVIDVTTLGELRNDSGFGAAFIGALVAFFTSPIFWLFILLLIIFIVYRYFAILGKTKDSDVIGHSQIAVQPISPPGPVQQQFPDGGQM